MLKFIKEKLLPKNTKKAKVESKGTPPRHVAIIMDGNGRWAKKRKLPRLEGHRQGIKTAKRITRRAGDWNIEWVTLYAFSTENWLRPKDEVDGLMNLLVDFIAKESKELIENEIGFHTIGAIEELPQAVQKALQNLKEKTAHFRKKNLVLALNYGSEREMVDAVKAYTQDVLSGKEQAENLTWEKLSQYLYTKDMPNPDLFIRTSGECRTSNYLLMQSAYAEMFFPKSYWPEFSNDEFDQIVEEFTTRERRFGKTSEQIQPQSTKTAQSC